MARDLQTGLVIDQERLRRLRAAAPWKFCRACRRASLQDEWQPVVTADVKWNTAYQPHGCPYAGCSGRLSDTTDWWQVIRYRPQFPDAPERGIVYNFRTIICR